MAKAKRLNTTVHLGDTETGQSRVLGPNDKLSAADRKELEKRWGKRASEFMEDTEDDEPEDMDADEAMASGHPPADSTTSTDDDGPAVESAKEQREEARTDANPAGVDDSKGGKSR